MTGPGPERRKLLARAAPFALAIGVWLVPIPSGLTSQAWHLFAIFAAAIFSVILGAFPLLTAAMLAAVAPIRAPAPSVGGDLLAPTNGVVLGLVPILVAHLVVRGLTAPPSRPPPPL